MIGAVAGDVIGSVYEYNPAQSKDFELFTPRSLYTDDTVITCAVASAILTGRDYGVEIKRFGHLYPNEDYGGSFRTWLAASSNAPYNSWGNGSAMRVSPVGFAFEAEKEILDEARRSAEVTHNHPEGIKGAQATALAIFMARRGASKADIRSELESRFAYNLHQTLDEIRPHYSYDVSCQGCVPQSIIAFLESEDFEDALRNSIFLGGDADTMASITGGIAQAFYGGVPQSIDRQTRACLPQDLLEIIQDFEKKFMQKP